MDKLTAFFWRGRDKKVKSEGYLEKAEKAAAIVNEGIEKGSFSDINQKLELLIDPSESREKYVFQNNKNTAHIFLLVLCGFLMLVYLYFFVISLGTLIYSAKYINYATIGIATSLVIILFNIELMVKVINAIKFNRRYNLYSDVLKYRNIILVADLVEYANNNEKIVVKDLTKAIKKKLIPQGHLSKEQIFFMVSDDIYDKYMEKQPVYDRYYRKQLEERVRVKSRSGMVTHFLEMGQNSIDRIHEIKSVIKDKAVSNKIDRMEKIVAMIFHEIDINPEQIDKLGLFMNYYLPTTEKILEAYANIDEKQYKGKSLKNAKKEIEDSLDMINNSFEGILDKFYQEHELDITSDISAMEIIMKQEGM